ncbi:Holliday junction resolvase [Candidatus Desulfofervidus auxilii]|uniref:Crossover junction endodeoxyribonuclease RuvC n=1 Tax=Desulfofervidus auxilii TaxID=1621989 RepID=A0A7U4QL08_DESA2|nr:crossover junction endodeoxyribonuclease RuvC [Candidatus Desulfofervidus auxilii]CAD7773422.1 MAG: Crossover junction endodeoxyribonuclease RuvC [Candidatus Methanoperedenaceae archaeon GB37]CAD7777659.1 Crossover junction endodeoxyribonuclease RuvC [Candidatus Methanoperedenaceae archaeon GB50]AMM41288.1 Holliday junction resolvase [Candidatus Desulfofervidus auxilii]CAD7778577.1 Crossover junction endodeoxyribonuclease RuvC [Candidatus Methanoperedenaceae archaeon GB37]CAD7779961.1 MAG: 
MRVIGIDLGLLQSGYGIVERNGRDFSCLCWGEIHLPKKAPVGQKLCVFYEQIEAIIKKYHPHEVIIEEIYLANNVKTALALGQVRGVVVFLAERCGLPVFSYSPLKVKQAVVGYGLAHKEQVKNMVQRLLNLKETPGQHAADALGVALCHLQHLRL